LRRRAFERPGANFARVTAASARSPVATPRRWLRGADRAAAIVPPLTAPAAAAVTAPSRITGAGYVPLRSPAAVPPAGNVAGVPVTFAHDTVTIFGSVTAPSAIFGVVTDASPRFAVTMPPSCISRGPTESAASLALVTAPSRMLMVSAPAFHAPKMVSRSASISPARIRL
jgi:hypothetical protein